MRRLGLIGIGNMGSAILRGVLEAGYLRPSQLTVYDLDLEKAAKGVQSHPGVLVATQMTDLAECGTLLLAVKPNVLRSVLEELQPILAGKSIISIAAGWTMQMLKDAVPDSRVGLMRVMPNTPALVGEGMTAICSDTTMEEDDFRFACGIFEAIGRTVILPEYQFDGVVAISGSSPAYVYMMIEAMADAGVREGIPRATAYEMAAQSVLGSALMALSSGEHPAALKDAVCSPGGTTIEAVAALERGGFRSTIMEAMRACAQKSKDMRENP